MDETGIGKKGYDKFSGLFDYTKTETCVYLHTVWAKPNPV